MHMLRHDKRSLIYFDCETVLQPILHMYMYLTCIWKDGLQYFVIIKIERLRYLIRTTVNLISETLQRVSFC